LTKSKCPSCFSKETEKIMLYKGERFLSCSSLFRCKECELVYAFNLPTDDELSNYYNNGVYYSNTKVVDNIDFMSFSEKLSVSRYNLISKYVDLYKNKKLLDVGAGNAVFGRILKGEYQNIVYDVVEPDKEIKKNYGNWINNNFETVEEIVKMKYNLIILNQVLEHVNNPRKFINNLSEFLDSGSYMYIDIPFCDYLYKPSLEPHILFWNKKSLMVFLNNLGFDIIFMDTCGMSFRKAKLFFSKNIFRFFDPWNYINKINSIFYILGIDKQFNTFRRFTANKYGGKRQWLRCIAIKK